MSRAATRVADDEPLEVARAADRLRQAHGPRPRRATSQTTFVEFEILSALAHNPGRVFTRDMLLDAHLGRLAPTATRARSTCTSATCARSSSSTPRSPSTSSPCAASATASATRRRSAGEARARRSPSGSPSCSARSSSARSRSSTSTSCPPLESQPARPAASTRSRRPAQRYTPAACSARVDARRRRQGASTARVRRAADRSGARVTLLRRQPRRRRAAGRRRARTPPREVDIRDLQFDVATAAARTGRIGDGHRGRRRPAGVGEAALPLRFTRTRAAARVGFCVVVFSAPLDDVDGNVALIRAADPRRRRDRARRSRCSPACSSRARCRGASSACERAARRVAAGRLHRALPRRRPRRARPARARRSTTCSASSPSSTTARKRFIATASHELRTPIFSLGGFLELLEDEELDEETRAQFLAPAARAGRPPAARSRPTCSTCPSSRPARSSCGPSATDLGVLARAVAAEFAPGARGARARTSSCASPREPVEADVRP